MSVFRMKLHENWGKICIFVAEFERMMMKKQQLTFDIHDGNNRIMR